MFKKSHIDLNKLDRVPQGQPFEYKDIVEDDFPIETRTEDGKMFKAEVEIGMYDSVSIKHHTGGERVLYEKS